MNVVQYIGDKENASNQYSKFYSMAKEIVSIDPNFTYMYLAGSAIMMWDTKQVDEAVEFVQEGIKNNPTYWPLNLYLAAFTYSKANKFRHLVSTIETAVKMDGHPPMLERILGNLYVKLSEIESKNTDFWLAKAKNLWLDILYNSSDKANIQYAKEHLEKFKLQTTDNRL